MSGRIVMEMLGQNHNVILTVSETSPGKLSLSLEDSEKDLRTEITVDSNDFLKLLSIVIKSR